ncbi:FoF1 ATP synthase subunit gamma [Pararhodobacter sp.]|uniref:F0F1 ATP synthase subunit gamma n=1 Tax=Pararhodobacter sp. TaxID=2127056 RepID=UPI002AFF2302|nr:FoF1 ATP synthase subunit gamma [Pararhodobacter sp.]
MAQTLERLNHRIQTMGSIRGIVSTMKTMSAINALPYEQAAQAIEAYHKTVLTGFHAFVRCHGPLPVATDPGSRAIVIAFGSDHGLCGNYNEIIAEEALRVMQTLAHTRVLCIGAQMEDALIGQGITPEMTLLPPATADGLGRLSGRLITVLDTLHSADATAGVTVTLVHMQRGAHGQQHPITTRLLPLDPKMTGQLAQTPWDSRSLPQFRMPAPQLLAALIRNHLFARLFRSAAEAMVTENAARLARMQQAEQSIDDQLDALTAEMRSARQDEITTELLDVIIGFEALKARDKRKQTPDF